jgi:PPOX class probable F420-dependent enzyme
VIELATKLSEKAIRMIEGKNFGHFGTLLPDGSPHVTPVWADHDGDILLVNTSMGRVKQKNTARDSRVSISIVDQDNPYDRAVIQGRVVGQTNEGAEAHIDKLAKKYTGANKYERSSPTEKRVIIRIEPLQIL